MRYRLGLGLLLMLAPVALFAGVGVWTTNGPAGDALSVISDPRTPGVLYAGTSQGLFKSGDNGATWVLVGFQGQNPTPIATGAPGTIFATRDYGYSSQAVLYRSVDGGATWTTFTLESNTYFDLSVDPLNPTTLYRINHTSLNAGAGPVVNTFFRSTDDGSTWTMIDLPFGVASSVGKPVADPFFEGTLYVAAYALPTSPRTPGFSNIFKSVDSGSSWTALPNVGDGLLVPDPRTPGTIYLNESSASGSYVLAKSVDGGNTFSVIADGEFESLVIDSSRPTRLYGSRNGSVVRSFDGGRTWVSMGIDWLHPLAIAIDSTGSFLNVAGGVSGVYGYQFVGDPGVLPLNPGRSFSITLVATDQRTGRTGPGIAMPVNDLWGYFSIPAITSNPNNPEVFVKILDGRAINGWYWFFYGGLTDLEYTLSITDDTTGAQKTYTKPAGSECGGSDTAAFPP